MPVPREDTAAPQFARNAILLVIDGLRDDTVGPTVTPTLDLLAHQGVSIPSESAGGTCITSIAGLLTGVSPITMGMAEHDQMTLPIGAWTIADATHCAGLHTAMFAANGYLRERFGFGTGWDVQTNYVAEGVAHTPSSMLEDAWHWVELQRDERFFLYVHLLAHDTRHWEHGDEALTSDETATLRSLYLDDMRAIDAAIGVLVERLRDAGLNETTLVLVTSDRGEALGDEGAFAHSQVAAPALRRVPLIAWGARHPAPTSALASGLDVAPTLLDALGLDLSSSTEGRSHGPRGLHRAAPRTGGYVPRALGISRELCEQMCEMGYGGCAPHRCDEHPTAAEIADAERAAVLAVGRSCAAEAAYQRAFPADHQ